MPQLMKRLAGPLALALALAAPGSAGASEAPANLQLWAGAMPTLQLTPMTLEASKKKKKKKKAAPAPAPDTAPDAAPDLGTPPPDTSAAPTAPTAPSTSDVPAADAPSSKPVTPGSSSADSSSSGDMNFDLLGESKPKVRSAEEERVEAAGHIRRGMLTVHQGLGLGTLGLLAASCVVGQLNYMDKFSGNAPNNTARYEQAHTILAFSTLTGFAATGILGLTAPVPYAKPVEVDTTLFHKIFMGGATLGMASEMGLGIYTASHEGLQGQKSVAMLHQYIGYTTLALMGAGASAFIF